MNATDKYLWFMEEVKFIIYSDSYWEGNVILNRRTKLAVSGRPIVAFCHLTVKMAAPTCSF
jgi:hypothetical protein